jgi:hypothetical protein
MSAVDTSCNGWSNYATWRVNLELLDDYISQTVYDDPDTRQAWCETTTYGLAEVLKEYADDAVTGYGELSDDYDSAGGLAVSYARAFLDDVDWYEIAEHAKQVAEEAAAYAEQEAAA